MQTHRTATCMASAVSKKPPAGLSPSLCQLTALGSRDAPRQHQGTTCSKEGAQQGQEMLSDQTPHYCTLISGSGKALDSLQPCLSFPAPTINSQGSRWARALPVPSSSSTRAFFPFSHLSPLAEWEEHRKTSKVTNQNALSPHRELSCRMPTVQ